MTTTPIISWRTEDGGARVREQRTPTGSNPVIVIVADHAYGLTRAQAVEMRDTIDAILAAQPDPLGP